MSKMDNFEVVDFKWQSHLQAVQEAIKQQINSGITKLAQELIHHKIIIDASQLKLNEFRRHAEEYIKRRFSHLEAILKDEIFYRPNMILLDIFATKKYQEMQIKTDLIAQQCQTLGQLLNDTAVDRSEVIYRQQLKESIIRKTDTSLPNIESSKIDRRVREIWTIIRSDNRESKSKELSMILKVKMHRKKSSPEVPTTNPQVYD